jgi:FHA domain
MAELICPSCGAASTGATPLCPTCILPFVPRRPDPPAEPADAAGPPGSAGATRTARPGPRVDTATESARLEFPWGEEEVSTGSPLVVGREGSTLAQRLADYPNVSRRHAEIALADGRLTVEDLNSVNGTFVNDERVPALRPHPLADGDELRFAAALRATVRSAGDRGGPPTAARA